ncbi:hypothetical protein L9F63_015710, partial [Diploptera punctata]
LVSVECIKSGNKACFVHFPKIQVLRKLFLVSIHCAVKTLWPRLMKKLIIKVMVGTLNIFIVRNIVQCMTSISTDYFFMIFVYVLFDVMGRILRNNIESAPRTEHHTVNILGLIVTGTVIFKTARHGNVCRKLYCHMCPTAVSATINFVIKLGSSGISKFVVLAMWSVR